MSPQGDTAERERKMLVLLYEFPAETRLTVYRRLDIRKQWLSPADWGPRKMGRHHPKMIELARFWRITLRKVHIKRCRAYVKD